MNCLTKSEEINRDYAIEIVVKVSNACQAWLFAAVSTANKENHQYGSPKIIFKHENVQ